MKNTQPQASKNSAEHVIFWVDMRFYKKQKRTAAFSGYGRGSPEQVKNLLQTGNKVSRQDKNIETLLDRANNAGMLGSNIIV